VRQPALEAPEWPETVKLEMQSRRSYSPKEMLQSPIFYLLFIMMAMMSTSGLMVVSNVGPFATEYKVAQVLVFGEAALPLSLTLSRVTNGLTRPFFGWVSDRIGRESTMALAFSLEAIAIVVLFAFIDNPAMFVVLTGLVFSAGARSSRCSRQHSPTPLGRNSPPPITVSSISLKVSARSSAARRQPF